MKKIIYVLLGFIVVILLHLSVRYLINESFIKKYNSSNYDSKLLNILKMINYPESYIVHYNSGNVLYNQGKYTEAEKEYNEALKTVKGDRRCMVNINLSFTRLKLVIDQTSNTAEVSDLKEIQKILLDNNCATVSGTGTNKDSQKFYDYLEDLINNSQSDPNGEGEDPENQEGEDPSESEEYQEIEEKLREQQIQAQQERNKRNNKREYKYQNGKTW